MKYVLTILMLSVTVRGLSQTNLVPNWSFEEQDSCQTFLSGGSNIFFTNYWFSPFSYTAQYSGGAVELFSNCSQDSNWLTPNTVLGFQLAYDGQSYAGIYLTINPNREYIEGALTQQLQSGKRYCLRFRYSFADSSTQICNGLAAYFSQDSLMRLDSIQEIIHVNPQVILPDSAFVIDTSNWLLFDQSFIAQGGERYVTIGNFRNDNLNFCQQINEDPLNNPRCYIFIDAVEVFYCDTTDSITPTPLPTELKFYPNPADASFDIDLVDSASLITVVDAIGRIVYQTFPQSYLLNISTQYWSPGIYLVQVKNNSHQPVVKKLVVQH